MTIAERLAEYLYARGCTQAFGIVGGANSLIFSAFSKRMEVISVRQEQCAAQAAMFYYRTCRRIAPVLVTAGGGAINAMTGVMAAHMDGVPLLVISGNEKSDFIRKPKCRSIGFQGFLPEMVSHSFTKRTTTVMQASEAMPVLEDCYARALHPRQGACWIDIPQDIAGAA